MKIPSPLLVYSLSMMSLSLPVSATVFFEDGFDDTGLDPYIQVVKGVAPMSLSTAGQTGNAGQVGDGTAATGSGNQPSGWLQLRDLAVDPTEDFTISFDIYLVQEANSDDGLFVLGDLSSGDYMALIMTEVPANNDVFLYSGAVRASTPTFDQYAGSFAFVDDTWYSVTYTWTAATETLDFTATLTGSSSTLVSFSMLLDGSVTNTLDLSSLTGGVQFGMGTFNDTVRFDNVRVASTPFVPPPGTPIEIGNLDLDYANAGSLGTLPENWSFYWNPTGVAIGDVANYELLTSSQNDWRNTTADASGTNADPANIAGVFDSSSASSYGGVTYINSGLSAASSSDGRDHYTILAYTVQAGDEGYITLNVDLNSSTHSTFRLLVGSEQKDLRQYRISGRKRPTLFAGYMNAGETVYLAVLSTNDGATYANRRFSGNVSVVSYNTPLEPNHQLGVTNHAPGTSIGYPLALIRGTCDPSATEVSIRNATSGDAAISWPALGGYYKGLVLLREGVASNVVINDGIREIELPMKFEDPGNTKRVNPMYFLASDSTGDFIAPPGEPNNTESAKKRIGILALLCQTFTAQSLADAGYEPETFSLNLDPTTGLPIVQVYTSVERDEDNPVGAGNGQRAGYLRLDDARSLIGAIQGELMRQLGRGSTILTGDIQDLVIYGFTKYDGVTRTLRGHSAVAQGSVSTYSSINLHTWAETLEELPARFIDTTEVDLDVVPDDSSFRATYWGNYASAIGVCEHELGHRFVGPNSPIAPEFNQIAAPHQTDTIMGRGGDDVHRFFTVAAGSGIHPSIGRDSGRAVWHPYTLENYVLVTPLLKPLPSLDFDTWRGNFSSVLASELPFDGDYDKDGLKNLLEFGSGRNPLKPDNDDLMKLDGLEGNVVTIRYEELTPLIGETSSGERGVNFTVNGVTMGLSYSNDLTNWIPVQSSDLEMVGDPVRITDKTEQVTLRFTSPFGEKTFLRLGAEEL